MKVNITSIHFNADVKLEEFITEKLNKLKQFDETLFSAEVILSLERPSGRNYDSKVVKIKLKSKKYEYFAEKKSESFEAATDEVVGALRSQINKKKEKILKKK
jgi:putative sigma-54 modulation protein